MFSPYFHFTAAQLLPELIPNFLLCLHVFHRTPLDLNCRTLSQIDYK